MTSRALPRLTPDNRAFWTGGQDGVLNIYRCQDCAHYVHPPRPICNHCSSRKVVPAAVSGRGRIETFTVNYTAWLPDMPVPFVFAVVELVEQPHLWLWSNIVNCPIDDVKIGLDVKVLFENHDDVWLPMFAPATQS